MYNVRFLCGLGNPTNALFFLPDFLYFVFFLILHSKKNISVIQLKHNRIPHSMLFLYILQKYFFTILYVYIVFYNIPI